MAYNFFATDPFNFNTQLALGGIYSGCGDLGEMLATTARIVEGDADSWCDSWTAIAERVAAIADDCAAAGHPGRARGATLWALPLLCPRLVGGGWNPRPVGAAVADFPRAPTLLRGLRRPTRTTRSAAADPLPGPHHAGLPLLSTRIRSTTPPPHFEQRQRRVPHHPVASTGGWW